MITPTVYPAAPGEGLVEAWIATLASERERDYARGWLNYRRQRRYSSPIDRVLTAERQAEIREAVTGLLVEGGW